MMKRYVIERDLPGVGGMGQHYADTSRFDATIEPNRPEALVY